MRHCRPKLRKDASLRFQVVRELRVELQVVCLVENKDTSELLREFIQVFAVRSLGGLQ